MTCRPQLARPCPRAGKARCLVTCRPYLDWPQQVCGQPVSKPSTPHKCWHGRPAKQSEFVGLGVGRGRRSARHPLLAPCSPCSADSGALDPDIQATSWSLLAIACRLSHASRYDGKTARQLLGGAAIELWGALQDAD